MAKAMPTKDKRLAGLVLVAVLIAVGALLWSQKEGANGQGLDAKKVKLPEMTPALSEGKAAYDKSCAACHGANTAGTNRGPTFLNRIYHPGHHGDGAFLLAPRQGVKAHHWRFGDMKPVQGVSDAELKAIVGYVRAVQKANGLF